MECGCKHGHEFIEYCPLHAAAGEMLETLKEMVAVYPQLDRVPKICIERAKEVIATASKQEKS